MLPQAALFLPLVLNSSPLGLVAAQTTNATCEPEFQWTFNSLDQSPCTMVSYLRAACKGNHNIQALPPGYSYNGPGDPSASEPCWCSSVAFALYQACQLCQGRTENTRTWGSWTTNCTAADTNNGKFPEEIPAGTAIPAWAYEYTYRPDQSFSLVEAQNYAATNKTEITRTSNAPGSSSNNGPTGSGGNPPKQTEGGSGGKSNAGAIAGGVVGGVVGLALIAGAIFFFYRRRRHATPPAPITHDKPQPDQWSTQPPQGQYQALPRNETGAMRYYDPSDPSTFPTPPSTGQGHTSTPAYNTSHPDHLRPMQPSNPSGHPYIAEL